MNTLETPIIKTEIITHNFTHYNTQLIDFVLHKEVTLLIHLFNDGIIPTTIKYKIEGEEYSKWGDDDSYIEIIVKREIQKLYPIVEPIAEPIAEPIEEPIEEPIAEPIEEPIAEPIEEEPIEEELIEEPTD